MKVVINKCYGGFGLSHAAIMRYAELSGTPLYPFVDHITRDVYGDRATIDNPEIRVHYSRSPLEGLPLDKHGDPILPDGSYFSDSQIERSDVNLIRVIEEMGAGHRTGASGEYSKLVIVEIPDGVEYEIDEYDGIERIAETHRTWG